MSQHDATRVQLERKLSHLLNRAGKIEADLRRTHDRDWAEQAPIGSERLAAMPEALTCFACSRVP